MMDPGRLIVETHDDETQSLGIEEELKTFEIKLSQYFRAEQGYNTQEPSNSVLDRLKWSRVHKARALKQVAPQGIR